MRNNLPHRRAAASRRWSLNVILLWRYPSHVIRVMVIAHTTRRRSRSSSRLAAASSMRSSGGGSASWRWQSHAFLSFILPALLVRPVVDLLLVYRFLASLLYAGEFALRKSLRFAFGSNPLLAPLEVVSHAAAFSSTQMLLVVVLRVVVLGLEFGFERSVMVV